jgi:hypothetical protein
MELASMLAGEPFSDHPPSVCPVVGSFLRAYNDAIDDRRRQDLYAYAAKVVGSRASSAVEHARGERLSEWAAQIQPRDWRRRLLPPRLRAVALQFKPPVDAIGAHAVHGIRRHTNETHAAVLALIDELLAIGPRRQVDELSLGLDACGPRLTTANGDAQAAAPGVSPAA